MKTIYLIPVLLLSACASNRKPAVLNVLRPVAGTTLSSDGIESVRYPELKQAYETLVKHLPEDQREKVMVSIASRTMRSITPRQGQSTGGARV